LRAALDLFRAARGAPAPTDGCTHASFLRANFLSEWTAGADDVRPATLRCARPWRMPSGPRPESVGSLEGRRLDLEQEATALAIACPVATAVLSAGAARTSARSRAAPIRDPGVAGHVTRRDAGASAARAQ
jgi:hypothetical protein